MDPMIKYTLTFSQRLTQFRVIENMDMLNLSPCVTREHMSSRYSRSSEHNASGLLEEIFPIGEIFLHY